MPRDERALRASVERSAAILVGAGFPKMPARVLMRLVVAEGAGMTAFELSKQLGASAAAISGAVRYLQTVGMVRRVAQTGSRRDRYELPEHAWYAAFSKSSPMYLSLAVLADQAAAAINDPSAPASIRLEEIARFYRFLDARLPELMAEWDHLRRGE